MEKKIRSEYGAGYDKVNKVERKETRPYDTLHQLRQLIHSGAVKSGSKVILDVGMGTGRKTLPLGKDCGSYLGIEPSEGLLKLAEENIQRMGLTNARVQQGVAQELPYEDGTVDMVISLLAPHDTAEAIRVLKSGGVFYMEKTGNADKGNIKSHFGHDADGPRGYLCTEEEGARFRTIRNEMKSAGLADVRGMDIHYHCFYPSIDEVTLMLEEVKHTVRGFSRERDRETLDKIEKALMTDRGIEIDRNDFVLIGTKP